MQEIVRTVVTSAFMTVVAIAATATAMTAVFSWEQVRHVLIGG
jgi:hypothetical protein